MSEVSMTTVIALIAFSDGELSMFKGEIREIATKKATQLISDGYVAEYEESELPKVGANDKDKYLHTNASTGAIEWSEVEAGGGGGGVEIVTLTSPTWSGSFNGYFTCDHTYEEIETAIAAGKTVVGCLKGNRVVGELWFVISKEYDPEEQISYYSEHVLCGVYATGSTQEPNRTLYDFYISISSNNGVRAKIRNHITLAE